MAIYTGEKCSWCGKEDMTVLIMDLSGVKENFMLCIPCLVDVHEDWKSEQASTPALTRIK